MKKIIAMMTLGLGLAFACPGMEGKCGCMGPEKGKEKPVEFKCPGMEKEKSGGCGMPACGGHGEPKEQFEDFQKTLDKVLG